MVQAVIGLGSNLGPREHYLRQALHFLCAEVFSEIRVSSLYDSPALLPKGAPRDWDKPFLNLAVCGTLRESDPLLLLQKLKNIEKKLGRLTHDRWAPREIDLDILDLRVGSDLKAVSFQSESLTIPHPHLSRRPFAFLPLLELEPQWPMTLMAEWDEESSTTKPCSARLGFSELVGILNVTPDSFSDGGKHFDRDACLKAALGMAAAGAAVLDIGAESTRPGAAFINPTEEWARLDSVLRELRPRLTKNFPHVKVSIDTRNFQTAEKALEFGVDWINDVSGFSDARMLEVLKSSGAEAVAMHSLSVPADPQIVFSSETDVVGALVEWSKKKVQRFEAIGIDPSRLILDPGLGFGKTAEQSVEILRGLSRLQAIPVRWLIGHSRKSFLKAFGVGDRLTSQRDPETAALSVLLDRVHIAFLRVHDVEGNAASLRMARRLNLDQAK